MTNTLNSGIVRETLMVPPAPNVRNSGIYREILYETDAMFRISLVVRETLFTEQEITVSSQLFVMT